MATSFSALRGRRSSPGQALVEFALIIPIFILLVMGIFDLGRAVYGYNTANNAAREAARMAIVDQTLTHIKAEAVAHAPGLSLAASNVTVDFRSQATPQTVGSCSPARINCLANVRVNYSYQASTPIIGNLLGVVSMMGESQFPVEAVCAQPAQPLCPKGN